MAETKISIKVTKEIKKEFEDHAERVHGLGVGPWLRMLGLKDIRKREGGEECQKA